MARSTELTLVLVSTLVIGLSLHGLAFVSIPAAGVSGEVGAGVAPRGEFLQRQAAGSAAPLAGSFSACGAAAGFALVALAGLRRCSSSAVARAALGVGQKVTWNGKPGTVAYVGPTKFAAGDWVGVALDGPGGMHDGTVMGVQYFSCTPRTGIFATEASLAASGPAPTSVPSVVASAVPTSEVECSAGKIEMCVGCKVLWYGKSGTVAYIGSTKFAPGEWVGVELDAPSGMHDGTVMGVTYFAGKPKHGIFALPSVLTVTAPAP